MSFFVFFFSSRRRHTRFDCDWSSDVCSSDLSRRRRRKLPNPRSSIFSPRCSASMMLLNTVSTMTSECFLVRSETRDTSSTSSAFVMLPAPVFTRCSLAVPEMIAERRRPRPFAFRVGLEVGAIVVRLQRADAQPDLPLLRAQLDDLHLVAVPHL